MTTTPIAVRIFCSYSDQDEKYVDQLKGYLGSLQGQGPVEVMDYGSIEADQEWEKSARSQNLETSDIILLLISPDYLASDFIYQKEMELALERHKQGEARVIPIITRPTDWTDTPVGKLEALPSDA